MTRPLLRACLDCRTATRGKTYCVDCRRKRDQAKRAKRPRFKKYSEAQRRARAVARWRAEVGDWCPGVPELRRPAHPAANLSADHIWEVRLGGPEDGPLVVRCIPCNAARSAVAFRSLSRMLGRDPAHPERPITHDDGPAVA
jgi:5-methylcytosine-specific restriction enzyme A